jgi:hypothetical protein
MSDQVRIVEVGPRDGLQNEFIQSSDIGGSHVRLTDVMRRGAPQS